MFKIRFISGAILTVVIGIVLAFSHIPAVLNTAVAIICLLAVNELYRAAKIKGRKWAYAITAILVIVAAYMNIENYKYILLVLFAEILFVSVYLMRTVEKKNTLEPWITANMAIFIVCSFNVMSYVRELEYGLVILTGSILVCFAIDISAYIVGTYFGKRKLAPRISPGKTVEGSIGAVLLTMCLFIAVALICQCWGTVNIDYKDFALYLIGASILGQMGDLTMSAIKRRVWIKDYGRVIPGHGGILDRFDSLLFVLPFTYLYIELNGQFLM